MFRAISIFSSAQREPFETGRWPHDYEDLDQKFFKRSRLNADVEDPGDGPGETPPPQPAEGPAPPVHSRY